MTYFRQSRFTYGTNQFTTELSARPWIPADNTIGGSRTSAAGIPASYIVRRDNLYELTLRVSESEWPAYLALIRYAQTAETIIWYPDADDLQGLECYLESPLAGERWAPTRMSEFLRVFEVTLVLRQASSTIWQPYFVDTVEDQLSEIPGGGPGDEGAEIPDEGAEDVLYFEDDQSTADFGSSMNGYGWSDFSGGGFNPEPEVVADAGSPSGYAIRFRFVPTVGGSRSEARLVFGDNLTDVFIAWSIKYPANYFHRNGPSSDNNKVIRVWGNAYSTSEGDGDPGIKSGFSSYPSPSSGGGDFFNFSHETIGRNASDGPLSMTWSPTGVSGVNLATDLAVYRRYVFRVRRASGPGSNDGIVQFWIDGVNKWTKTNADLWDYSAVPHNYFDQMYLMGAANSGFSVQTDILIQGVKIGATYDSVA